MTSLAPTARSHGFWRWILWPEKTDYATWEVVLMRLGFVWVLLSMGFIIDEPPPFLSAPYPNGLAHFMDLSFLRNPDTVHMLCISGRVCLVLGTLGIAEPLTFGWLLFVIIAAKSYNQSQGNIGHGGQLVTLGLLAQWLASLRALLPDAAGVRGLLWAGPASWKRQAWWMLQALTAGYTVSAITKLIHSHGMWAFHGGSFVLHICKAQTEMQVAEAGKIGPTALAITEYITSHLWVATIMLMPTFLLEFGAFAALINRRLSVLLGLGLIAFHQMAFFMMGIAFQEHQTMLWIFLVNPVYWLVTGAKALAPGTVKIAVP